MAIQELHKRCIKSRPSMKYHYFTCFLVLLGSEQLQQSGLAVAFTTTTSNRFNKVCHESNSVFNRNKNNGGTLYVSNPVDDYVETIPHNKNNNNNNNNNNNQNDGATLIEIHTEELPFDTTTNPFTTLNTKTKQQQTKKTDGDTIEYKFFTGDSRKRKSLKKKQNANANANTKMTGSALPTPVSKLYRNANKALRRDTSSARLSRAQETDLAYAIQDLKTAIRVRDELNDPLEDQWAAACNLTVRQLRRVMIWGREARAQLVAANVGLVRSIAKKYSGDLQRATQYSGGIGTILTLQDMIQEGNLGLMEAAERFEPSRGFRFSTYASYWVRQRILQSIANHSRVIRLPAHVHSILRTIHRTRQDMEKENGNLPSIDELANRLDMPVDKLQRYTDSSQMVLSLEGPLKSQSSTDERTLGERIASDSPSPEEDAEFDSLRRDIRAVMDSLGQREKEVLIQRFGLEDGTPKTVEETSRGLGISRDRVRNVEARALNKLRHPQRNYKLKEYVGEQNDEKDKIADLSPEEIWSF